MCHIEDWAPNIGQVGAAHSVGDSAAPPRLWAMKSVSKAGAIALDRRPAPEHRPVGFAPVSRAR